MTAVINFIKENQSFNKSDYPSIADGLKLSATKNYALKAKAYINAFALSQAKLKVQPGKLKFISELNKRLTYPYKINQLGTPFCGAAAFFYSLATHRPDLYARFFIDLVLYGKAAIGTLQVDAADSILSTSTQGHINILDWITLGTLVEAENVIFPVKPNNSILNQAGSITMPATLASWFRRVGC